ncbi:MAG: hypothetical protein U9Q82_13425 [Chloroflexota bacterium]|nr:hypothetical protein [Chloroflexota bacterium]
MTSKVECRSEYEYAQRPIAIHWKGERLKIEAIEASWQTPIGKYFRVRSDDAQIFELVYDQINDEWKVDQL